MWESVWRLPSRKWSCWVTERERSENTRRPSGSPVSLAAARRSAAECQCPLPCPRGLTVLGVVSPVCLVESDTFVVQFYINFPSCTGYTHITPNRKNSVTLQCHPLCPLATQNSSVRSAVVIRSITYLSKLLSAQASKHRCVYVSSLIRTVVYTHRALHFFSSSFF